MYGESERVEKKRKMNEGSKVKWVKKSRKQS